MVDIAHGILEHGERFEPQEVEFDEPRFFDFGFGILCDDFAIGAAKYGDIIPEWTFGDDDTGGMHTRLAKQIFDFECRFIQKRVARIGVEEFADFFDRFCALFFATIECGIERNRMRVGHESIGDELRNIAQLLGRKTEHAPD